MRLVLFLLASLLAAGPAAALSFQLVPLDDGRCGYSGSCPSVVRASGQILSDDVDRFEAFLAGVPESRNVTRTLVIQSPGGHMLAGIKLGIVLRALKFHVIPGTVGGGEIRRGVCGSACVFVLMGGAQRSVPPGSVVAVHQPKLVSTAQLGADIPIEMTSQDLRQVTRGLSQYSTLMGIDPALITLMMQVPPTSRRVLTTSEIRRFRLTNSGPRS